MSKVLIHLPKTGLGNRLLVWARGALFARLNGLEYITSSWWGFHWGALLRRERKTRLYRKYFIESSLHNQLLLKTQRISNPLVKEPEIEKTNLSEKNNFLFNTVVS